MNVLALLGTTFGLSFVSGIRLYATIFGIGLAVRLGWLQLKPELAHLNVIANDWVIIVSGILFLIEFFADKISWLDTTWDLINSIIRPIGGVWLASQALGNMDPAFQVLAVLAAGTVTVSSASAKAVSRVFINKSPEPVSNVVVSFIEDFLSAFFIWLSFVSPVTVFIIVVLVTILLIWLVPKAVRLVFRGIKSLFGLLRKKTSGTDGEKA